MSQVEVVGVDQESPVDVDEARPETTNETQAELETVADRPSDQTVAKQVCEEDKPVVSEEVSSEEVSSEEVSSEEVSSEEVGAEEVGAEEVNAEQLSVDEGSAEDASADEKNVRQDEVVEETIVANEKGSNGDDLALSGFRPLGLSNETVRAVCDSGYTVPTPIQAQTIPHMLAGRDVLGQAQTGTGKTAAFALPLLDRIDPAQKQPQVLVLTPTRELAIQVAGAFEKYAQHLRKVSVAAVYGGQDYQIQLRQLKRGAQIVVGTPGRVMDHMRRGALDLEHLICLTLDEADDMLRMGFADDVEWVLQHTPAQRQIALFSATMPPAIREIARNHLHDPAEITIAQKTATADTVRQRYVVTTVRQKRETLARVLEAEPTDGVMVFVRTRSQTEPLAAYLAKAGLKTAALSGDIAQKQRERIVDRLRAGQVDVIVATDVAARGLDVQRISHVVNYDLPHDTEVYVHRIGRTGRAGRSGEAILFLQPRERFWLRRIEKATNHRLEEMEMPSNRELNKRRIASFHERITEGLAAKELETFRSIVEQYQRANDVPLELIAASLAALAQGDKPLFVREQMKATAFDEKQPRAPKNGGRRNEQSPRGKFKQGAPSGKRRRNERMDSYRIEVGRKHRVQPGNIVGAIANEGGLDNESIGKIQIFDRFSTVDLPTDIHKQVLAKLQSVTVSGRMLKISPYDRGPARVSRQRKNVRSAKSKRK